MRESLGSEDVAELGSRDEISVGKVGSSVRISREHVDGKREVSPLGNFIGI